MQILTEFFSYETYFIPNWYFLISAWDESDNFVKIYLTGLDGAKDLPKEAFEFQVEASSVLFKVKDFKGKNMIFNIKETTGAMNIEKSYYKAKSGEF